MALLTVSNTCARAFKVPISDVMVLDGFCFEVGSCSETFCCLCIDLKSLLTACCFLGIGRAFAKYLGACL